MTRRQAILAALGAGAAWGFAPGDVWYEKQPSEWSAKDIQRLLTKSPWAKEVSVEMSAAAPDGGGRSGGGAGGRGGPGGGGPGGGGPPGGGGGAPPAGGSVSPDTAGTGQTPQIKVVVRWESAFPLRAVAKAPLSRDPSGFYVIAIAGLPRMANPTEQVESLKTSTYLQRKGKDSLSPAHVDQDGRDGTMLFYFPVPADTISLDDKEVNFRTRLGSVELKARFILKEMAVRGKLAI